MRARGDATAILLTVSNEGPPIPVELLPTLFEPMTRGTGEGSEGGRIEVNSTAEAGTSFRVLLPRVAA